jgi:hypothetical protein
MMRLTHLQRIFSLDITHAAWGQTILGVPVKQLRLAEDMAALLILHSVVNPLRHVDRVTYPAENSG